MNSSKILLAISTSMLLLGCGGGGSGDKDSTTTQQRISIPKEINIDIPKALKEDTTSSNKRVQKVYKEELGQSRGYQQLKEEVAQLEWMKSDLETNLFLADQLMKDIESHCEGIPVGTTCTIPANVLSLTFDQGIINELNAMTGEDNSEILEETIPLGEVRFTQYSEGENFQYALSVDTPDELGESTQIIKWSKDENRVFSSYTYEDSEFKNEMTINYLKKANGEKEMRTDDTFLGKTEGGRGSFHFKIVQLADAEEHFKITSNGDDEFTFEKEVMKSSFSSQGEISKQGGFLTFMGTFGADDKFKEKELFDGEGNVISSSYCDTVSTCDLEDESTWLSYGKEFSEIEDDFDFDIDESFEVLEEYEFIPLSATGGNLQEGNYLLLAPSLLPQDVIMEQLDLDMIFNATVGDIYSFDGRIFGTLYSSSYQEQLNSLIIIQEIFPENEEVPMPTYLPVANADRPTLAVEVVEDMEVWDNLEPIDEEPMPLPDFEEEEEEPEI